MSGKRALIFTCYFFQEWQKFELNVGIIFDYIFEFISKCSFGLKASVKIEEISYFCRLKNSQNLNDYNSKLRLYF